MKFKLKPVQFYPGLLAYIATNKYCDALPLYRQTELFKRIGIEFNYPSPAWLWTYNNERPNMALGGITPTMKLALAA